MTFMLPGIIALTALGGAIGGGTEWLNERIQGIVREYLAAPIPRLSILFGNALSATTKSLFQAVVIMIVGVLIGAELSGNPLGWLGGLLLVAGYGLGFSGIAIAVASRTDSPGGYHMLIFMLNLPLLFLSNALYPLQTMPTWMEIAARINPTTYVVTGMRQMTFGGTDALASADTIPLWLCFPWSSWRFSPSVWAWATGSSSVHCSSEDADMAAVRLGCEGLRFCRFPC